MWFTFELRFFILTIGAFSYYSHLIRMSCIDFVGDLLLKFLFGFPVSLIMKRYITVIFWET